MTIQAAICSQDFASSMEPPESTKAMAVSSSSCEEAWQVVMEPVPEANPVPEEAPARQVEEQAQVVEKAPPTPVVSEVSGVNVVSEVSGVKVVSEVSGVVEQPGGGGAASQPHETSRADNLEQAKVVLASVVVSQQETATPQKEAPKQLAVLVPEVPSVSGVSEIPGVSKSSGATALVPLQAKVGDICA